MQTYEWTKEKQALLEKGYVVYIPDGSLIKWTPNSYHDNLIKIVNSLSKLNINNDNSKSKTQK
jgi:hypothetical protein